MFLYKQVSLFPIRVHIVTTLIKYPKISKLLNQDHDVKTTNMFIVLFFCFCKICVKTTNLCSLFYFCKICEYFRMEEGTRDDIRKLLDKDILRNKRQQYDHQNQIHSISLNPISHEKLPLVVKYPRISRFYEKIRRDHEWAQFRMGVHNGLFHVPDVPRVGQFEIPTVKILQYDPVVEFFHTSGYKLLVKTFNKMYKRLTKSRNATIYDETNRTDFAEDQEIMNYGM